MSSPHPQKSLRWFHKPIPTTLLYLVIGVLLMQGATDIRRWIFFLVSAILFCFLVRLNYQRLRIDRMTNLPNRTYLNEKINRYIKRSSSGNGTFSLLYLDVNRFNQVNDMYGHEVGDVILQQMVARLKSLLPSDGFLARFTGVEFVMLLPGFTEEETEQMAEKVVELLSQRSFETDQFEHYLTISIGLALYPRDGHDATSLLRHTDLAMNRAKEKGKNQYLFYTSDKSQMLSRKLIIENGLRSALKNGEFSLCYQPKIAIETGDMIGMEALLRWKHPTLDWVSPAEFIPIAEETGLIVPIGKWVLRTACEQNKRWQEEGLPRVRVAVNLSIRQFETQNLVETVQGILEETGLHPSFLELEITESIAIIQDDYVVDTLNRLKQLGILIAIDDFGTGYSSLSYLKHFSIDSLKIDQSFIRDLDFDSDADGGAIVKAISTMAQSLRLNIVAEGVEKPEQMAFLQGIGCHEAQGYWISKPLSAEAFREFLVKKKGA